MNKQDTNFGELILSEAKKVYGDDFDFTTCVIEKCCDEMGVHYVVTWDTPRVVYTSVVMKDVKCDGSVVGVKIGNL